MVTGAAPAGSPRVVLTGPPGAGKSTTGRALAVLLGVPFADTDDLIVAREGMEIPDIFLERGEDGFRAAEREVVAQALAEHPGVLALGGGAVLAEETRAALAGHPVIFLDVDLAHAVKRTGLDQPRPLLALNPRSTLLKLMQERRPVYEAVATFRVDTSERTPEEIAAEIAARLGGSGDES